jgi:hypothetical protein
MRKTAEHFSLLLVADAKLVEAGESLRRAGLTRDCAQIASLRTNVARLLANIQDDTYAAVPRDN